MHNRTIGKSIHLSNQKNVLIIHVTICKIFPWSLRGGSFCLLVSCYNLLLPRQHNCTRDIYEQQCTYVNCTPYHTMCYLGGGEGGRVGREEAKGVSDVLSAQWCLLPRLWYMSVCLIVSLGMRHSQDVFTVYGYIFCLLF